MYPVQAPQYGSYPMQYASPYVMQAPSLTPAPGTVPQYYYAPQTFATATYAPPQGAPAQAAPAQPTPAAPAPQHAPATVQMPTPARVAEYPAGGYTVASAAPPSYQAPMATYAPIQRPSLTMYTQVLPSTQAGPVYQAPAGYQAAAGYRYPGMTYPGMPYMMSAMSPRPPVKPGFKLTYFNIEGVAEKIRLAMKLGRVPFEDERVDMAQWPETKGKTPFGQLPLLTLDGRGPIAQSGAILHFIGRITGMYPTDPYQAMQVDEVLGLQEDLAKALTPSMYVVMKPEVYGFPADLPEDQCKDIQRRLREKLSAADGDINRFLGYFEGLLEKNASGWFVGPQVTIADCAVFAQLKHLRSGRLDYVPTDMVDRFPRVAAFYDRFYALPAVFTHYNPTTDGPK